MKKTPSLESLLIQIGEMLDTLKHYHKPISEDLIPVVNERLKRLENAVAIFRQHQQETFQEAHIDIERVIQNIVEAPQANERDKQFLKRAKEVERDARSFHIALTKALATKQVRKNKSSLSTASNQEQIKERRKLFKPLGGDKKWIPL